MTGTIGVLVNLPPDEFEALGAAADRADLLVSEMALQAVRQFLAVDSMMTKMLDPDDDTPTAELFGSFFASIKGAASENPDA